MYAFFAFRNLSRRRKRYIFIFSAMALSFAVMTIITGISSGALRALQDKAARYFAGHISITGFLPGQIQEIEDSDKLISILQKSVFPFRTIAKRTVYYRGDAQLFFEGERVLQRKLIGVDLIKEGAEFKNLNILEGSFSFTDSTGKPGIVISQYAAKILHCNVGDELNLFLRTYAGQANSASLVVRGIFNETSLFGFAAYVDRVYLNSLLQKDESFCTDIALYVSDGTNLDYLVKKLSSYLGKYRKIAPLFASRDERDKKLSEFVNKEPTLVILTQEAQLAQIQQFISAFLGITYFILVLFILITITGVINTYRVLIHERKKEIGVLRALGVQKTGVMAIFLWEGIELSFFASLTGFVIGCVVLWILSMFNFSFIPGSGLILERGHIRIFLPFLSIFLNLIFITVATIVAIFRPAHEGSHVLPVQAMKGGI